MRVSAEMKETVIRATAEGLSPTKIEKQYGVDHKTVYAILDEAGIERKHRDYKGRYPVCPKCGAKASSATSRFCHMCGASLKSDYEIAVEDFKTAIGNLLKIAPSDEACEVVKTSRILLRLVDKELNK